MALTGNLAGSPTRYDLGNQGADALHLMMGEAISASEIANPTAGHDVFHRVPNCVVETVTPARLVSGSTIGAWLWENPRQQEVGADVALSPLLGIHSAVSVGEKHRPTSVGAVVSVLSRLSFRALLWRVIGPSLCSPISTDLPRSVTFAALVSQPERPRIVAQEHFRRSRKLALAAIANAMTKLRGDAVISRHPRSLAAPPLWASRYGPHWQLPWKFYP